MNTLSLSDIFLLQVNCGVLKCIQFLLAFHTQLISSLFSLFVVMLVFSNASLIFRFIRLLLHLYNSLICHGMLIFYQDYH